MNKLRILIADDEAPARFGMARALKQPNHEILEAADGQAAVDAIRSQAIDLVFLDLNMPVLNGGEVLRQTQGRTTAEIIVVTANDRVQAAVECVHLGAADYIAKPFEVEQIRAIARRVAKRRSLESRIDDLQSQLKHEAACGALLGTSQPMRTLFQQIRRAAQAEIDVLIRGETGTGKELIAREIHRQSSRSGGPFVAVNTAAVAESLAESELFGHVRGAFTGAAIDRAGVFEQAHGGTLFLDEIGDMPSSTQAKILRALQERCVQRVGATQNVAFDVRIITATHQDLEQAVEAGRFRRDLYFRIRGLELSVPPLRHRREDILLLAGHFLEGRPRPDGAKLRFSTAAIDRLLAHVWHGNVRELEQVVRAATAMCAGEEIRPSELGLPGSGGDDDSPLEIDALLDLPLTEAKVQLIDRFERLAITRALERRQGNVSAAARDLGLHRQSLQQKIAALGIAVDRFTGDSAED